MAKSLPTGCTKGNSDISWETFNFLLEKVDFEDTISQLLKNKKLLILVKDWYFNY